jgi:enoyl-CoA hydratase
LSPEDARGAGLVDQVVAPEELIDRALAAADALASIPAPTFELTKRQIREPVEKRIEEAKSRFDPAIDAIWGRPETREAIQSYMIRTFKK